MSSERGVKGFRFEDVKTKTVKLVKQSLNNDSSDLVGSCKAWLAVSSENDIKTTVDQAFREVLFDLVMQRASPSVYEKLLNESVVAAESDVCSGSLPVLLLSDLFDCLTLDKCEELFSFIENRVQIWKMDFFFKNCKNQLLRSCNDLLRRLSRSQNTVFCGRILVFLAKIFPLSERSGLNVVSEFNLDNVTLYSSKDDTSLTDVASDKDDGMEEGEMDDLAHPINVDYNLYRKFWSLQEFFHQPIVCYNKMNWRHFASYSADVLSAFESFKLDDIKSTKWKLTEPTSTAAGKTMYFAKYLTSQKLLELELSDSNFRRYVLVQFLILFQYLRSTVRFKQDSYILTEEQNTWIRDTTDRVYKLLEETPPDGSAFAKHVDHILKREEYWNKWKNDGCPDFKEVDADAPKELTKPTRPRLRVGDEIRAAVSGRRVLIGNAELNRLWNLCPDNWEACRTTKRDFMPSLDTFFDTAIEQANPANQIEDQYKHVHNSNYGWRALRLLSQKSPNFFTNSNMPIRSLPLYLESMVLKVAKEFPLNPQQNAQEETKPDVTAVTAEAAEDSEDELLKSSDDAPAKEDGGKGKSVSAPHLELLSAVSSKVHKDWKVVAAKLGFQEDEIAYFEAQHPDDLSAQCRQMLLVWTEQEFDAILLANILDGCGLTAASKALRGWAEGSAQTSAR